MLSRRTLGDVVNRAGGAVSVADSVHVTDLSSALRKHHVDAAAVLTPQGVLAGIVTSSDVARSLARGEPPTQTPVTSLMTVHPAMLPPSETPANALALMRAGGFRHLPVVDATSGTVLGIVDVLHLAYDVIVRLQNSYALPPTRRSFLFQRAAREAIEKPTLRSFADAGHYATLQLDCTALQACEAFVREKVNAVVVVDARGSLEGIFTCRDVVSRVVSVGLDPTNTLLRDIMTPRPNFALPDFTVLECLQRMQACGFRHLPIVDGDDQVVVGLVDVLQLASDALAGLAGVQGTKGALDTASTGSGVTGGGISGLFISLFGNYLLSSSSEVIQSQSRPQVDVLPRRSSDELQTQPPSIGAEQGKRQVSTLDSADLAQIRMTSHYAPGVSRRESEANGRALGSGRRGGSDPGRPGVESITFKFIDADGEYRRIKVPRVAARGAFDRLIVDVRRRYYSGDFSGRSIKVKYVDDEGDPVVLGNDDDLAACFEECADQKLKTAKLIVTEMQFRRSTNSLPSPVSSLPGSPSHPFSHLLSGGVASPSSRPSSVTQESGARPLSPASTSEPDSPAASPSTARAIEAHELMMNQKVTEALAKYDDAIRMNARNPRALAGRGAALLLGGNATAAEKDYRASLKMLGEDGLDSSDRERTQYMVVVGLVETLIDQRRYEEAGDMAEKLDDKAAKVGCGDALNDELQGTSKLAFSSLSAGEHGEATTFFTNAIRVENAFIAASDGRETCSAALRTGRAKCYFEMEDYEMAIEDFECSVVLDPESVAAWKGCAKCYVELDQIPKALEAFEKAGKLDAGDEAVQVQIATLKKLLRPEDEKKESIAALGAMLSSLNLPGSVKEAEGTASKPAMTGKAILIRTVEGGEGGGGGGGGGGTGGAKAKRKQRKKGKNLNSSPRA